jgi:hypothetical protein
MVSKHIILLRYLFPKWRKGDFFLGKVGVDVIQRLGYAILTAPSHLVAKTRKYEAVFPFPSKPAGHDQRQICLGRITGKKAFKRN